jgi:hypothetical protein
MDVGLKIERAPNALHVMCLRVPQASDLTAFSTNVLHCGRFFARRLQASLTCVFESLTNLCQLRACRSGDAPLS